MNKNLKLVIVGHIDHGKSTLIGRLLYDTNSLPEGKYEEIKSICESLGKEIEFGYVMDNLEEERDQGITIDTAQIFFNTKKRQYTIIDAPGHVEFIKNMITGASQAEAAILLVDIEEGIQEQTRRHAYILSMLGLKQTIVVVNKMDMINYDQEKFKEIKKELISFLDSINIKPSIIIPISAKKGDNIAKKSTNMSWYNDISVLGSLDQFQSNESNSNLSLRFSVQDIYKQDERIIVGRVESGTIKKNQEVIILPSKEKTIIKSIKEYNKNNITESESGKCPGIITQDKLFLDRGNIISCIEDPPKVTNKFKAHIFWMSNEPLKKGERILLKCGTQETICSVEEFKKVLNSSTLKQKDTNKEIQNREVADVIITTDKPIIIENFNKIPELGRFVLERLNTCAGGIITEV